MEEHLLKIGSEAFKKIALNEEAKDYVLNNPLLFKTLKKAAQRYLGGETLQEAIITIRHLNKQGFVVTTDYMGESIRNAQKANEATQEFITFGKAIQNHHLDSSISLDLSHIGLLVSKELALENLQKICAEAQKSNQEVIISMEGTERTGLILDVYEKALKNYSNLGITLQAYLYRTKDDFQHLIHLPGSIRLVKGAYEVPDALAMPRGEQLDDVYLQYAETLLSKNHACSIASHHEKIHQVTIRLIDKYQPTHYVLERLYGIRNEELKPYKEQGYNCRVYVVYGKEWFLYMCNRWAEYPLNLFQGIADILA
ncbi:proline dehydrogenase [marine bacterium AO1-C]|nr:proline dehydrogenase [marine bacterium AO1-C]